MDARAITDSPVCNNAVVQSRPVRNVQRLHAAKKRAVAYFLTLNRRVWERLPSGVRHGRLARLYGTWLHALVRQSVQRQHYLGTFFLRNRPALELMRRLAEQRFNHAPLRIAVLGCSVGAEVYSILWVLRSSCPHVTVTVTAVDISEEMLSIAKHGVYGAGTSQLVGASIFERLTKTEMAGMFDWEGNKAKVKPWLKEGIRWELGDACDWKFVERLGRYDIVVASNFLCHMAPAEADKCLRNVARLVAPGGYLFVSGVDLDVRTQVALDLGWEPVPDLLAEIHNGDPAVCGDWPWQWWGLEPFDQRKRAWRVRYAAVFRNSTN
jgi:chemotaxis methyl-accepting protein methylase